MTRTIEIKRKIYLCVEKKQSKTKQKPKLAFIVFMSIPNCKDEPAVYVENNHLLKLLAALDKI